MKREKYLKKQKKKEANRKQYLQRRQDTEWYEQYKEERKIYFRKMMASGQYKESIRKKKEKKNRILRNTKYILEIEGVTLYERNLTINEKIKRLKRSSFLAYTYRGIIPKPIYRKTFTKPWGNYPTYTRQYYSERQIKMLNQVFSKYWKRKTLEEKGEYLRANWTKGELGFGGESKDGGTDE